jgi:HAD superfamily hydrolase (TIGR01490 family)
MQSGRDAAAFFDLDKTVIARASMVAFGRPLQRGGLLSRRLLLRALYGQFVYLLLGAGEEKLKKVRTSVLAVTRGWDQARVRAIVEESLEQVVEPIIYAEALDLMQAHQAEGRMVLIVSAAPEEIVTPLARHLGADGAIATRALLDDEGRYTGEVAFWAYGPWKAEAMRGLAEERGIDLDASYAYSDSATDLPMLEAVGHPVVVNPDRELARVARQRQWEVVTFARPVRLRDRVPVPPARPALGGTVLAAVAGVAAWWWRRRAIAGRATPSEPSWRPRRPARRG